ncbi:hypothetical protein ACHAWF_016119 [Thalassiosira exigua]
MVPSCLVLLLCLCLICTGATPAAESSSTAKSANSVDAEAYRVNTDAINSIVSRISSWMKDKQKHDQLHDFEDIAMEFQQRGPIRPFVTLAYAQTLDGMIATKAPKEETTSSNMHLSSPPSMLLTHHLRRMHDAILVGGSTFLRDTPRLNVRLPGNTQNAVELERPMPVVLDTRLSSLQRLVFGGLVAAPSSQTSKEETIPDMSFDKVRAHQPVICCSSEAAHSFLDILEIFQDQQAMKRRPKKTYTISVVKKIDENGDSTRDIYMPIKITVRITHHKKHEDDEVQDVTFTLLPCTLDDNSKMLDLNHVLIQLREQFEIDSVMCEGGAGILSSFSNSLRGRRIVDCICVTIAPTVIGGKCGLPAFGELDISKLCDGERSSENGNDDDASMASLKMLTIRKGNFVPMGQDCTFVGRFPRR